MNNLPSGTVTFLFTDIEGSTKLAQGYPNEWEDLRARHHAILQSAMDAHNGYVFQIIGDAFCVAFHTASDALNAAIQAQRDLKTSEFSKNSEVSLHIRMGLHTGSAELQGNEYRGYLTMAKVQRVMSVAYGGQVLLSNSSAELLHGQLQDGITLRDMKDHRLKGLTDTERLWQLVAPDLRQDFPALQSLKETPNNLPLQLTSFIGREKEVGQIKQRLEKNRLVTLTGSGGIGKTRLSIQVASELLDEYPNGVWLVELAPITDPALVTQTVCAALDVTPQGNASALNVLTDYLKPKKILLVVDNCEHLIDAAAQLCEALLHACPNVRIIASSREALGIDGENAYRVPSLSLPNPNDGLQTIEKSEAVKLFMERATATLPEFEMTEANASVVAQICHRLDGIALAIELATSRVKLLKVEQIASRLDDVFRLLTGGSRTALPRQQTLRALIDWSYNLLSDEERTVLRRLSVFVGGWTLEAAEYVCDNSNMLDLLTHLVDKSLVAVDHEHGDEPRYYLLETIRQYAREKLNDSGEGETIRERHLDYYMQLAEDIEERIKTAGQALAIRQSESEFDNFRVALAWSLGETTGKNCEKGLRLANAVDWVDNREEGVNWLQRGLAQIERGNPESDLIRAKALMRAGRQMISGEDSQAARALLEESLALYRAINPTDKRDWTMLLTEFAFAFLDSDTAIACTFAQDSVTMGRSLGPPGKWELAWALSWDGIVTYRKADHNTARARAQEGLVIFRELGDSISIAQMLLVLGWVEMAQKNYEAARSKMEEAYRILLSIGLRTNAMGVLTNIARNDREAGNYETARSNLEEVVAYSRDRGDKVLLGLDLLDLGETLSKLGEYEQAAMTFRESLGLLQPTKDPRYKGSGIFSLAKVFHHQGHLRSAAYLLGALESETHKELWTLNTDRMADYVQSVEATKAALGDEAYAAAYESGKQMSLDEAVAYALKELEQ